MARMTREKFVIGGVAIAGGLALGQTMRAGALLRSAESGDVLVGRVKHVRPPSALLVAAGDADLEVVLEPEAHVFRETEARLVEFLPGERIVAEGAKQDEGTFVATSLVPLFIVRETDVVSVSPGAVDTPDGRVRISEHALFWSGESWAQFPPTPITPGRRVQFVARKDLASGDFVGVRFDNVLAA